MYPKALTHSESDSPADLGLRRPGNRTWTQDSSCETDSEFGELTGTVNLCITGRSPQCDSLSPVGPSRDLTHWPLGQLAGSGNPRSAFKLFTPFANFRACVLDYQAGSSTEFDEVKEKLSPFEIVVRDRAAPPRRPADGAG